MISVTPSRRETKGVTGLKPDENGYKKEDSPYGDAFSTVMHRVFELLVLHRALMNNLGEQKVIDACIRRAVAEYTNATYDPGCMGDATADGAKAFKAWLEQTVVLYFWMEKLRPTL